MDAYCDICTTFSMFNTNNDEEHAYVRCRLIYVDGAVDDPLNTNFAHACRDRWARGLGQMILLV